MNTEDTFIIDEAYGFKSMNHLQTRDGIIFNDKISCATYILKPICEGFERKIFISSIYKHLNSHGFCNTDSIILTKSNNLSIEIDTKKYVCSKVLNGKQCSAENLQEVKKAAKLLAFMHNCSEGFTNKTALELNSFVVTESENTYIKNELGELKEVFVHRSNELARFRKLAARGKSVFDYEYRAIADKYCSKAFELCQALKESKYGEISAYYDTLGTICHKKYTFHNVIFNENCEGGIINFEQASIDLPLFDIVNLIKRRMKKCGWKVSEALEIMEEYSKIRNLSQSECEIMCITLSYPQKLWRVVNKYYNSRRSWCEKSCLLKLSEFQSESEEVEKFLKDFTF